jgi:hypothetical protein
MNFGKTVKTMKNDDNSDSALLRQKAEELLKKKSSGTTSPFSEVELLRLIHELEVHQIELELQNEELRHAWAEAERANDKYIRLYDYAPSGYFSLSSNGGIIELNLSGATLLGKYRQQLKNKLFVSFISEETKPIFRLFLEKVFQTKSKETCEVKIVTNGNITAYVLLTGAVTENQEQCNVTAVDITERRTAQDALRSSLSRYQTLFDLFPAGITISDSKGQIIETNTIAQRMLGLAPEQQKQRQIDGTEWQIIRPDGSPMPVSEYASVRALNEKCQIENVEMGVVSDNGQIRWLSVSATPIPIEGYGVAIVYHDITAQKQSQQELLKAKEKAEESDRLKSTFLANMSHEIRTPMNGILGFASLLKEPNLTGEDQQKYIRIIEKSGARMLNIINDIVDISKIEAGLMEVNLKETNINDQIEYIYNFFKPEVEGKGMHLLFKNFLPAQEAIIETDREKIYAILTNLVKNSIKYSKEGSIEFGYTLVETQNAASSDSNPSASMNTTPEKFLQFFVKDTGIGVAKNRQEAIFERFIQADIEDTKALQGSGLGLTISKAYVEMLGGTIWVNSDEGIGSIFYFTIPYNTKKQGQDDIENFVSAENTEVQVEKLKVLIAEDDETSDFLLTSMLDKISDEVMHTKTGIDTVDACRNNPNIDLILMDIRIPKLNGYEATRKIREFNTDVIIIAQTAYGLSGDRQKAIAAGCNEYLSKPIDQDELLRLMQKYFRK